MDVNEFYSDPRGAGAPRSDLQGEPGGFEELIGRLDKAGYPPPW